MLCKNVLKIVRFKFKDLYLSYHHIEQRKMVVGLWVITTFMRQKFVYISNTNTRVTNVSLNEFVWSTNLQTNDAESLTPTTSSYLFQLYVETARNCMALHYFELHVFMAYITTLIKLG